MLGPTGPRAEPAAAPLKQGHIAALDQRIALRFHLDGLPLEETAAYADSKGIVDESSAKQAGTEIAGE